MTKEIPRDRKIAFNQPISFDLSEFMSYRLPIPQFPVHISYFLQNYTKEQTFIKGFALLKNDLTRIFIDMIRVFNSISRNYYMGIKLQLSFLKKVKSKPMPIALIFDFVFEMFYYTP